VLEPPCERQGTDTVGGFVFHPGGKISEVHRWRRSRSRPKEVFAVGLGIVGVGHIETLDLVVHDLEAAAASRPPGVARTTDCNCSSSLLSSSRTTSILLLRPQASGIISRPSVQLYPMESSAARNNGVFRCDEVSWRDE